MLTAHQEELLNLQQLRQRMPGSPKQQDAVNAELESLGLAATDESRYLRLTEVLCSRLIAARCEFMKGSQNLF